jgi:hypothetical protein
MSKLVNLFEPFTPVQEISTGTVFLGAANRPWQEPPNFDPQSQPDPVAGDLCWYFLKDSDSPWPRLAHRPVRVYDVRPDWVLEAYEGNTPDATKMATFKRLYRRVTS